MNKLRLMLQLAMREPSLTKEQKRSNRLLQLVEKAITKDAKAKARKQRKVNHLEQVFDDYRTMRKGGLRND